MPSRTGKVKLAGKWADFASFQAELLAFIEESGTRGVMPKHTELVKKGRSDLANAVSKHGGYRAVAQRLGLALSYTSKPLGYWKDFSNVAREVFAFIGEHGIPNTMPSVDQLVSAGRSDLANAIGQYGGYPAVAERLGLVSSYRRQGYWDDFENVKRELIEFVKEQGAEGFMPTNTELVKAERRNLAHGIEKHGGYPAVAEKMGLKLNYDRQPRDYWKNFYNLMRELLAYIDEYGQPGVMPTSTELTQANKTSLVAAIIEHDGFQAVAQRLGLQMSHGTKTRGYWDDIENVKRELLDFVEQHGMRGVMPGQEDLVEAGRGDLPGAIRKHGGYQVIAALLGLELSRKPRNYWSDFANLKGELLTFVNELGIPGVMPRQEELVQAGRSDLVSAIRKHGGYQPVAQQLDLELSSKPRGYWDDFGNLAKEIYGFLEEYHKPGQMPTDDELMRAGRGDLVHARRKHGGIQQVAQRLGLTVASNAKPVGYWDEFDNLKREIDEFLSERGVLGVMPTKNQLKTAGRSDLTNAIRRHGGVVEVAKRLGYTHAYKPSGYWKDFSNLEHELRVFIHDHGTAEMMPTADDLARAGKGDIAHAVQLHGGYPAVAKRLGLRSASSAKPRGYWNDFANVRKELTLYIGLHGTQGIMPTSDELVNDGYSGLAAAVLQHDGFHVVASRMELVMKHGAKPRGFWADLDNVEREVLAFIQEQGTPGVMPTSKELVAAGRSDLGYGIGKHGGFRVVAHRLSLELSRNAKAPGYWEDFPNVGRELLAFIEQQGQLGFMPSQDQLLASGRSDLVAAFRQHGGHRQVAERLGLRLASTAGDRDNTTSS